MLDLEPYGPLSPYIYWKRRAITLGAIIVIIITIIAQFNPITNVTFKKFEKYTVPISTAELPESPPKDKNNTNTSELISDYSSTSNILSNGAKQNLFTEIPPFLKANDSDYCSDSVLAIKAVSSQLEYLVGEQPRFTIIVTNIGLSTCKRDIGPNVLVAYIYSLDNNRLWSSLDCPSSRETLTKTFHPGEQLITEITWSGMGSIPKCQVSKHLIGPGVYNLIVQLDSFRSPSLNFSVT